MRAFLFSLTLETFKAGEQEARGVSCRLISVIAQTYRE